MKKIKIYLLLLLCVVAILDAAYSIWTGSQFMISNLVGSAILLTFVLTTFVFKVNSNSTWNGFQKLFFVLSWIYSIFISLSALVMAFAGYQSIQTGSRAEGNLLYVEAIVIAFYAFLAINYLVLSRRNTKLNN